MKEIDSSLRPPTATRRDEIVALRKAGLSNAEIGRRLGVTRERVRQVLLPKQRKLPAHKRAPKPEPMLTTAEASRILAVHPNTLRRWADGGIIRAYRIGGRNQRRFLREDIDSVIQGGDVH